MDPLRLSTPLLGKTQTPKRIQTKEGDSCISQEYSRHQEQTPDNIVTEGEVTGMFMFDNFCQENPCDWTCNNLVWEMCCYEKPGYIDCYQYYCKWYPYQGTLQFSCVFYPMFNEGWSNRIQNCRSNHCMSWRTAWSSFTGETVLFQWRDIHNMVM